MVVSGDLYPIAWWDEDLLDFSSGQTVNGGVATEADTALSGAAQKAETGGVALEADTAVGGTVVKPIVVNGGVALEADAAQAGAARKSVSSGTAPEVDTAQAGAVVHPIIVNGGVALEADTAQAGVARKAASGGVAPEVDSAVGGTALKPITVNGGVASEVDTAPAGTALKPIVVNGGVALEVDTAQTGAARKAVGSGTAPEVDTAQAGAGQKSVIGGTALEVDTAVQGSTNQPHVISGGVALEVDTAQTGAARKAVIGGVAGETDSAIAGSVRKAVSSGVATGTDASQAGTARKAVSSGVAFEVDSALVGTAAHPIIVNGGVAIEIDSALAGTVAFGSAPDALETLVAAIEQHTASALIVKPEDIGVVIDPGNSAVFEALDLNWVTEVAADNPTTWLRFNETSGTAAVDTQGAHNGTYVNTPLLGVDGLLARDRNLGVRVRSAQSEEITVPNVTISTSGTIEFWFSWDVAATGTNGLGRDNTNLGGTGWILGFDNAGTFAVRLSGTTVNTNLATTSVKDGKRHHLAIVRSTTTAKVYLDGTVVASPTGLAATAAVSPWHLGRNGTLTGYADGVFDEFLVYQNIELAPERVRAHYFAGKDEFADFGGRSAVVVDTMPGVLPGTDTRLVDMDGPHNEAVIAHG